MYFKTNKAFIVTARNKGWPRTQWTYRRSWQTWRSGSTRVAWTSRTPRRTGSSRHAGYPRGIGEDFPPGCRKQVIHPSSMFIFYFFLQGTWCIWPAHHRSGAEDVAGWVFSLFCVGEYIIFFSFSYCSTFSSFAVSYLSSEEKSSKMLRGSLLSQKDLQRWQWVPREPCSVGQASWDPLVLLDHQGHLVHRGHTVCLDLAESPASLERRDRLETQDLKVETCTTQAVDTQWEREPRECGLSLGLLAVGKRGPKGERGDPGRPHPGQPGPPGIPGESF